MVQNMKEGEYYVNEYLDVYNRYEFRIPGWIYSVYIRILCRNKLYESARR